MMVQKTYASVLKKLKLNLLVGTFMEQYISDVDTTSEHNAQRQAHLTSREARIARRKATLLLNEQQTRQEGNPYQEGPY